jgi:hypothetical protein
MMGLALLVACLMACTGTAKRMYEGPTRSSNEIAILEESKVVRIINIDGKSVKPKYMDSLYDTYHVLPGPHTIQAILEPFQSQSLGGGYYDTYQEIGYTSPVREIKMDFRAGHRYRIDAQAGLDIKEWQPEILDLSK